MTTAKQSRKNIVVIGGGAAGLFCAVNAARMTHEAGIRASVIVLEKTSRLLTKVAVSGGGRCNVTHACFEIGEMAANYPRGGRFAARAFYKWFTTDTIRWFAERGVALKTEADGRMFPVSDSSQTIIDCLIAEANRYGVEIWTRAEVAEVGVAAAATADTMEVGSDEGARFRVKLADSRVIGSDHVCIACGGYPKSALFEWVRRSGHTIEPPVPSLFTFNMPGHPITQLMGISVPDVKVRIILQTAGARGSKLTERGPLLITHWGLSGPVILRLSAWGARELAAVGTPGSRPAYTFSILVNWLPSLSEQALRDEIHSLRQELAGQKIMSKSPFRLPQRLWEFLLLQAGIGEGMRWAELPSREQNRLLQTLAATGFDIKGKTTFKEEFVTAGGVRLTEVDPLSMQSKKVPGLYFAGEILDVDGITGGFNFQHAWTSGWIAAKSMAASIGGRAG
ncbi:MAG: NAD(P)/FAD-dependent oxidoreductase [Bacteroidota bacterium]|nr:NAD(P)/FAD-dependent oxidoreductase [Bacteroidota bacterium]MDP4247322.1 NAD(P)/FAD-dependent oxidoreductase [Bacteroidota bacterium]